MALICPRFFLVPILVPKLQLGNVSPRKLRFRRPQTDKPTKRPTPELRTQTRNFGTSSGPALVFLQTNPALRPPVAAPPPVDYHGRPEKATCTHHGRISTMQHDKTNRREFLHRSVATGTAAGAAISAMTASSYGRVLGAGFSSARRA